MKSTQTIDILYILLRLRKIILKNDILNICFNKLKFKRLGKGDGSWVIVPNLQKESIVYSIGIGYNISFDLEMISNFGVNIYAYDPTPQCIEWLKTQFLPSQFLFHPVGLASYDGEISFTLPDNPQHVSASVVKESNSRGSFMAPVKRISSIMKENGHNHIDLLKIDIEGAEYAVIEDIADSDLKINQLLVEFHHRFPEVGSKKTRNAIKTLQNKGFNIVYVSQKTGEEYTFVKLK